MISRLVALVVFLSVMFSANAQKFIPITWVEHLQDDFSFTEKWEYKEGVYINQYGQVDYDYTDEFEPADMKELEGKIIIDSFGSFYKYVDTSHQYYTMLSVANFSEWAGSKYIFVDRVDRDYITCYAPAGIATHSELHLVLADSICQARVTFYGITDTVIDYLGNGGYFIVDRPAYDRRILKAKFYLTFNDADKPRYWNGLIYAPMTND